MSLFHLQDLKLLPQNLKFVPYIEHLDKFRLDLCILRYINSPKVSYLGMNPGIGWNPDLEESYLPKYRESEAEIFAQGTSGFYLHPVKMLAPNPSSISRYSECTKTTSLVF